MVFELLPLSVLAAETVPGDDELLLTETVLTEPGTETAVAEEDPKSGSCGPTATWKMEGDVLYIEGEGPMYDFVVPSYLPEPDKTVLKAPWKDEQFHYASCRNCWEDILEPHNWEYTPQPDATEPYKVEATCNKCSTTTNITIIPQAATIPAIRTRNENGEDVALAEDSYTVRWEDGDGNLPAEGTSYTHQEDWEVSEERPVIAVITFSEELQQAYSVGEEVLHPVTVLGERTEFVLAARKLLTIQGQQENAYHSGTGTVQADQIS